MQITWTKYTYVCDPDECDSLVEYTCGDTFGFPSGDVRNFTCPCGRNMNLVSVEPATIQPTNERNQMNDLQETYNPNLLVTYKKIENYETKYENIKVVDLEYELDTHRRQTKQLNDLRSQVNQIIDNLTEDYWYNPNTDKETVLSELCEILGHSPKKTIRFSGRLSFSGELEIDLADAEDFDLQYHLQDELSLDSHHGDIEIDSWDIDHVSED